jgi:hypothetical protein
VQGLMVSCYSTAGACGWSSFGSSSSNALGGVKRSVHHVEGYLLCLEGEAAVGWGLGFIKCGSHAGGRCSSMDHCTCDHNILCADSLVLRQQVVHRCCLT